MTTQCYPTAISHCTCNAHREGEGQLFGEKLQDDKSPSEDEKSFLMLTAKHLPNRSAALIYISVCPFPFPSLLRYLEELLCGEGKWKHMWAQTRCEERRPQASPSFTFTAITPPPRHCSDSWSGHCCTCLSSSACSRLQTDRIDSYHMGWCEVMVSILWF